MLQGTPNRFCRHWPGDMTVKGSGLLAWQEKEDEPGFGSVSWISFIPNVNTPSLLQGRLSCLEAASILWSSSWCDTFFCRRSTLGEKLHWSIGHIEGSIFPVSKCPLPLKQRKEVDIFLHLSAHPPTPSFVGERSQLCSPSGLGGVPS